MIDTLCLWTERITMDNMIMLLKETYRLNISSHHSHWQTTVFKETEKFPKSLWINISQSVFHLFLAGWLGLALSSHSSEPHWIMCTVISLFSHMLYFTTQITSDIELSVCFQLPSPTMVDEHILDLLYSVEFTWTKQYQNKLTSKAIPQTPGSTIFKQYSYIRISET